MKFSVQKCWFDLFFPYGLTHSLLFLAVSLKVTESVAYSCFSREWPDWAPAFGLLTPYQWVRNLIRVTYFIDRHFCSSSVLTRGADEKENSYFLPFFFPLFPSLPPSTSHSSPFFSCNYHLLQIWDNRLIFFFKCYLVCPFFPNHNSRLKIFSLYFSPLAIF